MLQYVFDTDHVTLYEHGHPPLAQRLSSHSPSEIGISLVTAEETLRGRLAALARARDGKARIPRYERLASTLRVLHFFPLVSFDQACEDQFQHLQSLRLRVGAQDLKIAAVALARGLILLSRNRRDFSRVPGIVLEDWS